MNNPTTDGAYLALVYRALEAAKALDVVPREWREAWLERCAELEEAGRFSKRDIVVSLTLVSGGNLALADLEAHQGDEAPARRRRGRPTKAEQWLRRQLDTLEASGA